MEDLFLELYEKGYDVTITTQESKIMLYLYSPEDKLIGTDSGNTIEEAFSKIVISLINKNNPLKLVE